ncbi:MAG: glycosyltransferase family 2 protein [Cyclobacteriaceae bacterium]
MTSPRVSIITITYNAGNYIEPTIKSVLAQNFESLEYIIIDGASNDNTLSVTRKYSIDRLISEPDQGVYDAMNKGLALAKGKYVLFLNAGDELASSSTLSEIFSSHNDPDVIYGETIIINPDRRPLGTRTELTSRKLPYALVKKDFLNGQIVSHQSFIPRRELCEPYDLKYSCSADIDWMLNIMNRAKIIFKTDRPISKYLQGGISDKNLTTCWKERLVIMMKHFNPLIVFWKHAEFVMRFLKAGAYKK